MLEDRKEIMNEVERNLLTAIQMYLYQVDRTNGVDIHSSEYKTSVDEQAMGMFKLVEDIAKGEAPEPTIDDPLGLVRNISVSQSFGTQISPKY
jgi:hypothetical protein